NISSKSISLEELLPMLKRARTVLLLIAVLSNKDFFWIPPELAWRDNEGRREKDPDFLRLQKGQLRPMGKNRIRHLSLVLVSPHGFYGRHGGRRAHHHVIVALARAWLRWRSLCE